MIRMYVFSLALISSVSNAAISTSKVVKIGDLTCNSDISTMVFNVPLSDIKGGGTYNDLCDHYKDKLDADAKTVDGIVAGTVGVGVEHFGLGPMTLTCLSTIIHNCRK